MTGPSSATRVLVILLAVNVVLVLLILLVTRSISPALPAVGSALGALIGWQVRQRRERR